MQVRNLLIPFTAIAFVAFPVTAQDTPPADPATTMPVPGGTLTPEQQAEHDLWSADQQAQYATWPASVKDYYWGLSAERQSLFWRLPDANKVTLAGLPVEQQEAAWAQVEAQAAEIDATPSEPAAEPTPDAEVEDEGAIDEPM